MALNYYNLASVSQYPISDGADCSLPRGILVDCSLRFPDSLGRYAFVSAAAVDAERVRLVFSASWKPAVETLEEQDDDEETPTIPIAELLVTQPATVHRPLLLTPLQDGVVGYVVLGRATKVNDAASFQRVAFKCDGPECAQIVPGCAFALPSDKFVSGIRSGVDDPLTGIVTLNQRGDVLVSSRNRDLGDGPEATIVFGLNPTEAILKKYIGPMGQRPDSGTCRRPGIERMLIEPDCDGNIDVIFHDFHQYLDSRGYGGIALDVPYSLSDVCTTLQNMGSNIDAWVDLRIIEATGSFPEPAYPDMYLCEVGSEEITSEDDPDLPECVDPYHDPRINVPDSLSVDSAGFVRFGNCNIPRKISVLFRPIATIDASPIISFGVHNLMTIELNLRTAIFEIESEMVELPSRVENGEEVQVPIGHPLTYWSECLEANGQGIDCDARTVVHHDYQSSRAYVKYYNYNGTCAPRALIGYTRHWLGDCERACADRCGCGTSQDGEFLESYIHDCSTVIDREILHLGGLLETQTINVYDHDFGDSPRDRDALLFQVDLIG
jgi:hypothetical protein